MKYRTMLSDISRKDECFGYIYVDEDGPGKINIGSVGTICKVTRKILLEDGTNVIFFDGTERFLIKRIVKTLPYFVAEVEPIADERPTDVLSATELEVEVYSMLKCYMRLLQLVEVEDSKRFLFSQAMKKYRPTKLNALDSDRRSRFSLALCHMMSMSPSIMQRLLQTTDTNKRLNTFRSVLKNMIETTNTYLISNKISSQFTINEIQRKSNEDDNDEDLLPPDVVEEVEEEVKDEWDISNMQ